MQTLNLPFQMHDNQYLLFINESNQIYWILMVAFLPVPIRTCFSCCSQPRLRTNASNLRNVMVSGGKRGLFAGKRRYRSSHLSIYSLQYSRKCVRVVCQCCGKSMFLSVLYFGISRSERTGDGDAIATWHDNLLWAYDLYGVCIIWCSEMGVQRSVCLLRFPILITRLSFDMTAYCSRSRSASLCLALCLPCLVHAANQWQWW